MSCPKRNIQTTRKTRHEIQKWEIHWHLLSTCSVPSMVSNLILPSTTGVPIFLSTLQVSKLELRKLELGLYYSVCVFSTIPSTLTKGSNSKERTEQR